jgi:ferredoxin
VSSLYLRVNPIMCTGRGICAEMLPEMITLDPWGYPIMPGTAVPPELVGIARRATVVCPTLALRMERKPAAHR